MIRVENIELIYFLFAIPILAMLFILMLYRKKKLLSEFGDLILIQKLSPARSQSLHIIKHILAMLAIGFAVVAVINIQSGSRIEKVKRKGVDLIIALDVSNSMLAEDIKPSRITKAKFAISRLIDQLENDRIGLIIFAGKAYTQLPITSDLGAAKMFLAPVGPHSVETQGTAIGEVIELAIQSFPNIDKVISGEERPDNNKTRAIIVISDGENHEDDPITAARRAVSLGITVNVVGIGSPEGAPIPIRRGNKTEFRRNADGEVVVTKLDEAMMTQIASAGQGTYVRANNVEVGLNTIMAEINNMNKAELESKEIKDYIPRYQIFLLIAFILLIIEMLIPERKFINTKNGKAFNV